MYCDCVVLTDGVSVPGLWYVLACMQIMTFVIFLHGHSKHSLCTRKASISLCTTSQNFLPCLRAFDSDLPQVVLPAGSPNDPAWAAQWDKRRIGLSARNMTNTTRTAFPGAWARTNGSSDVVVCVIDTGIDYNHPGGHCLHQA